MSDRETGRSDTEPTDDVDSEATSCHTDAVSDAVLRSDDHDERPLESFFHALQHGNDHSPGLKPSDFAAIVRRDRDSSN